MAPTRTIPDSDDDGLPDGTEVNTGGTNPRNPDSDGDGLNDGDEDKDHNGTIDPGESDPLNPDTDGGGTNDGDEAQAGSDPNNSIDDIRRVVGSGCSSSGNSGLVGLVGMMFALLALTRRGRRELAVAPSRRLRSLAALGAVVVVTAAGSAGAQGSAAIDVQQFRPAPGKADVLGLHSPGVQGDMNWRAGLYFNYAHEPLVVVNPRTDSLLQHLVRNQLGFDVIGAIGLGQRFELGLVAPLKLQRGEFNELPTGNLQQSWKGGLGDLRLVPKVLLLERETWRLGLAAPVVLPTGGASDLRGQKGLGVQPRLAADYAFESGARVLANVGINVRSRQELLNLSVGNELSYALGTAIPFEVKEHPFTGLASLGGAVGLGATGGVNEEERPLELQAGLQTRFGQNMVAMLGVGRGLTLGYGMPVFRVFTGFSYTVERPPKPPVVDTDGDGLEDDSDACPTEAEDKDGFEDEDGCPDPDNDRDGILDAADKCPNEPEDKDGFQDEDGCPELDNDQDGIVDAAGQVPDTSPRTRTASRTRTAAPTRTTTRTASSTAATSARTSPRTRTTSRTRTAAPTPTTTRTASPTRTTSARTSRRPTTASRTRTAARTRARARSRSPARRSSSRRRSTSPRTRTWCWRAPSRCCSRWAWCSRPTRS